MDYFEQYCWPIKGLLLSYMATIYLVFPGDKTPISPYIYHEYCIATWNPPFIEQLKIIARLFLCKCHVELHPAMKCPTIHRDEMCCVAKNISVDDNNTVALGNKLDWTCRIIFAHF